MMNTARPLLFAVAAVVTSFVFALWLSQHRLNDVEANIYEVAANAEPSVVHLEDAQVELERMGFAVAECVALGTDLSAAAVSRARSYDARTQLHESLAAYERLGFFPGEEALYRDARAGLGPVDLAMKTIVERMQAGDTASAQAVLERDLQPGIAAVAMKLKAVANHDKAHAVEVLEAVASDRRRSWNAAVVGTGFSLVLSAAATSMAAYALWKTAADRRRLDEERGARLTAEQHVRLRDQFLTLVSHELRSPLTALQLAVEALSRKPERPSESLHSKAMQQVSRMNALVEDLILVAQLNLGAVTIQPTQVDLLALVRERIQSQASAVERSGSSVQIHGAGSIVGCWDRWALGLVVDKVLSNAIRFGAGHPIDVTVSQHDGRAQLAISDRGIGVPPELLAAVFDRFQRGVSERNYPGLGLGLFIARSLLELMGGTIVATSVPSQVTTFTVALPCGKAETSG